MTTESQHDRGARLQQMAHKAGHTIATLYNPDDPNQLKPGLHSLVSSAGTSVFWHDPGKSKCVATYDEIETWLTDHPDGKGDTPKMKEDRKRGRERREKGFRDSVKD